MAQSQIGDRAWEVDWCADLPVDESGDSDLDRADQRTERFRSEPAANRRARAVLKLDAFGAVTVTPVEFTAYDEADARRYPHVGFWEPIAEPEYIDE